MQDACTSPAQPILEKSPSLKSIHRACNIIRYVHGMFREAIAAQTDLTILHLKGRPRHAFKILGEIISRTTYYAHHLVRSLQMTEFDEIQKNIVRKTEPVSGCPPLAMLRAHAESALPSEAEARISAHLAQCKLCRMLLKDLPLLESQQFTPPSKDRTRSNIPARRPKKPSTTPWFAISAIAAGLAFIASLLVTANRESTREIATTEITQPIPQSDLPQSQVQITKLPPPPPTVTDLVFRGAVSATEPDAAELAPAFAAYNSNNYALAASRFSRLTARFPNSDIPVLYLGVSQLLAGNNSAALASLTRADAIARPRQKAAAAWYHAAAALLSHSPDAPALLRAACNRANSPYSQQACSLTVD